MDALDRLIVRALGDVPGHPFHGNQWTNGGKSHPDEWYPEFVTLYHGTTSDALASIKEKGLVPSAGLGGDAWRRTFFTVKDGSVEALASEVLINDRKASVFLTPSAVDALTIARAVAETHPGSEPVVLGVAASVSTGLLKSDEEWPGSLRHLGKIGPYFIKGVLDTTGMTTTPKNPTFKPLEDAGYYVVLVCSPAKPRTLGDVEGQLKEFYRGFGFKSHNGSQYSSGSGRNVMVRQPTRLKTLGGPGSGNFGHAGRPGEVGGSGSGGQTDTPAFKAWFGRSKVVDAKGQPLKVYHATNVDPTAFKSGTHFGTVDAANQRAEQLRSFSDVVHRPAGPFQIMPVYLSIQHPLRLPDMASLDENTGQPLTEAIEEFKKKYPTKEEQQYASEHEGEPHVRAWEDNGSGSGLAQTLVERDVITREEFWDHQFDSNLRIFGLLEKKGYDGIVYQNYVEDPGKDSWIAFHPNQVKSALGNTGAFSKKTKLITGEYVEELHPRDDKGQWANSGETNGPRTARLIHELDITEKPSETAFVAPDGTRIPWGGQTADTHYALAGGHQMSEGGHDPTPFHRLLDEGVMRYNYENGVEVSRVPTEEQAQLLKDDWTTGDGFEYFLDVLGRNHESLATHTFAPERVTSDAIRNFVRQALLHEKQRAAEDPLAPFAHLLPLAPRVAARLLVLARIRVAGDVEGHPFHGNQYTDVVGGPSIQGSPDAKATVQAHLAKLPSTLMKESMVQEIHAFTSHQELAERIDGYLLKHYGFTASESAAGLVDRERGVMYTLTDAKNTYTQFAHTLVDRIKSPEWRDVTHRHSSLHEKEDEFVHAFQQLLTPVAKLSNPISTLLEESAAVFKKWGWL